MVWILTSVPERLDDLAVSILQTDKKTHAHSPQQTATPDENNGNHNGNRINMNMINMKTYTLVLHLFLPQFRECANLHSVEPLGLIFLERLGWKKVHSAKKTCCRILSRHTSQPFSPFCLLSNLRTLRSGWATRFWRWKLLVATNQGQGEWFTFVCVILGYSWGKFAPTHHPSRHILHHLCGWTWTEIPTHMWL